MDTIPEYSTYPDPQEAPNYPWLGQAQDGGFGHVDEPHNESTSSPLPSTTLREDSRAGLNGRNRKNLSFEDSASRQDADFLQSSSESSSDAVSDADSDYHGQRAAVAKFKRSVRLFRAEQALSGDDDARSEEELAIATRRQGQGRGQARGRGRGRYRGRGGRGRLRGPRKAAEPTGDIKMRLGMASQAFIEQDYEGARAIIQEIIRINAETYEAWTLLASVWRELGDMASTLNALIYAAHLRPKNAALWMNCANFALNECGEDSTKFFTSASMCYSSALRAEPQNIEARLGKADVSRKLGNLVAAASSCKFVLKLRPYHPAALRLLAEIYVDQGKAASARDLYREAFANYMNPTEEVTNVFDWSDVNIYIELHAYLDEHATAISELKRLSRWLVGRHSETFWDDISEDDREWDADDSRRMEIPDFDTTRFASTAYGKELPLELRVKLGVHRLSLGNFHEGKTHLRWLQDVDESGTAKVSDYPDLFREAGGKLQEFKLYEEALTYYEALRQIDEPREPSLLITMGQCYLEEKQFRQAEECFLTAIQLDEANIESRLHLAKLYEGINEQQQAFLYVSEVIALRRSIGKKKTLQDSDRISTGVDTFMPSSSRPKSYYKPRRLADPAERERQEQARSELLQAHFNTLCAEQVDMRLGQPTATEKWMAAAKELIADFRSFKPFYPWDKYLKFLGYSRTSQIHIITGDTTVDVDLKNMANRLEHDLGVDSEVTPNQAQISETYRGVSFSAWLDIFIEYALQLVRIGRALESYEICEAAKDAIVFYHSREDMFLIHVCWSVCALFANDEETCVTISRFFMKDYQFTTDSYRMFAALTRMCQSPVSWYTSGPSQKYILRQIKSMDYALVSIEDQKRHFADKASYSAQDENGQTVVNTDMDIALLMVYGQILYTSASYSTALNYFFRAHALDPSNPMINLSIGLSYVHYGLKRQAENRQNLIAQGLTYIFRYYDDRSESAYVEERQEAHYNVARTFHLLALTHLAVPYYAKVLQEDDAEEKSREDLVVYAAYNLQLLQAAAGELSQARRIGRTCLTV